MVRNIENSRRLEAEYRKSSTTQYNVRFTETSGVPAAIQKLNQEGIPTKTFIREAVIEKLRRDGYLPEQEE